MTEKFAGLCALVPASPDYGIDWAAVEHSPLSPLIEQMKRTQQDALWHGEGNVWNHVKLVCENLVLLEAYRSQERHVQEILFLSALLHDIGKVRATHIKNGRIRTPRHGEIGSRMARRFLWRQCGLFGTREKMLLRETICRMIRYHMAPPHMLYGDTGVQRVLRIAAEGELVPDFTLRRLAVLSEADNRGRICSDLDEQLTMIERSGKVAREKRCYDGAARFSDAYTERAFFSGADVQQEMTLKDVTWGEVILLCGLEEAAMDVWIEENCPDLPVIQPDDAFCANGTPEAERCSEQETGNSERANAFLEARRPFVWKAENLTQEERALLVRIAESHGAGVRLVYLETARQTQCGAAEERMLSWDDAPDRLEQLTVPERHEARQVKWLCM